MRSTTLAHLCSAPNSTFSKKIQSFAHGEFNKERLINEENIKEKIKKGEDIFERGYQIKKVQIDSSYPRYILNNKDKLKDWIV